MPDGRGRDAFATGGSSQPAAPRVAKASRPRRATTTRKSHTFVCVGPVLNSPPAASKKRSASVRHPAKIRAAHLGGPFRGVRGDHRVGVPEPLRLAAGGVNGQRIVAD